jgi:hypothetical protein
MVRKMKKVVSIRDAVERIQARHAPGKLVGLYRGLRRSHVASVEGGWCSASLLTASILNQMILRGSKLWWDITDLEFGSLVSPDSMRDDIGIRTLAGKIEKGIDSPSFLTVVAHRFGNREVPRANMLSLKEDHVNALVTEALVASGLPSGGFFPMLAHLGDAAREANLNVHRVTAKQGVIHVELWDELEPEPHTSYSIVINPEYLIGDVDLIRTSLANRQGQR